MTACVGDSGGAGAGAELAGEGVIEDAWSRRVLAAFSASAAYDAAAGCGGRWPGTWLGFAIARPSQGVWMDLGSGTGRLADDLERLHPANRCCGSMAAPPCSAATGQRPTRACSI